MAALTPAQLQPLSTYGQTVTDTALFIVQQGTVVGKVNYAELKALLITAITNATDASVATRYNSALTTLNNMTTQLSTKAALNHTHTPASVGLGNVANIAPLQLPISTAMQAALNLKANLSDAGTGAELQIAASGPEW